MWTRSKKTATDRLREYDRMMLRSSFVTVFWAAIQERRKAGKFTLQGLAKALGTNKSAVSRWFSGQSPNWQVDTISDIADALNLELRIEAIDRTTGAKITPTSVQYPSKMTVRLASDITTAARAAPPFLEVRTTETTRQWA
jgi:transcriptional regulator with XRE-family HTH domain